MNLTNSENLVYDTFYCFYSIFRQFLSMFKKTIEKKEKRTRIKYYIGTSYFLAI